VDEAHPQTLIAQVREFIWMDVFHHWEMLQRGLKILA